MLNIHHSLRLRVQMPHEQVLDAGVTITGARALAVSMARD